MSPPSLVSGPRDIPLIRTTIGAALEAAADRWGDREALVVCHQGVRMTWKELDRAADEIAAGLLALGFEPGDRLGVWAPNCAEWVLAQFATAKAGIIQVNINPAYRVHELEYVLNKVGCRGLVLADRFKTSDYISMLKELAPELDRCAPGRLEAKRVPALRTVIRLGREATPGMLN